jgi:hypothetical protein
VYSTVTSKARPIIVLSARNCEPAPTGSGRKQLHAGHPRVEPWLVSLVRDEVEHVLDGTLDHDLAVDASHAVSLRAPAPWLSAIGSNSAVNNR